MSYIVNRVTDGCCGMGYEEIFLQKFSSRRDAEEYVKDKKKSYPDEQYIIKLEKKRYIIKKREDGPCDMGYIERYITTFYDKEEAESFVRKENNYFMIEENH